MSCIFFHNWGKYERIVIDVPARRITERWGLRACSMLIQQRACRDCGKLQREVIDDDYVGTKVPL